MPRILIALLLLCIVGCASKPTVTHVVICWLKTPGDETARQTLIDWSYKLKEIPGVVSITAGRPIPSTRPVVDSTYDVAFVMQFRDEQALQAYEVHPNHKKAVSEVLRPLTAKVLVYDIKRGESVTKR